MDKFPADFNLESIQKRQAEQATVYQQEQQQLLAKHRQTIYDRLLKAVQAGQKVVLLELPDEMSADSKVQIARELCERFPDRVYYRCIREYQDFDKFLLIDDHKNPPACFEYKVILLK